MWLHSRLPFISWVVSVFCVDVAESGVDARVVQHGQALPRPHPHQPDLPHRHPAGGVAADLALVASHTLGRYTVRHFGHERPSGSKPSLCDEMDGWWVSRL